MQGVWKSCVVIVAMWLIPTFCFPWAEGKHSIDELLIQELYLDTNYVFCGSDASWGTNVFGLFVFDRRTEEWTNYSDANGFPLRRVIGIDRKGDFIYVTSWNGVVRFDRYDGSHEIVDEDYHEKHFPTDFTLEVDGSDYRISRDSVIVEDGRGRRVYAASPEEIPPTRYEKSPKGSIFTYPVLHDGRIFLAYIPIPECSSPESEAGGVAAFDLADKSFHFYPTDILKRGDVTGAFVWDSSIVFPTADFVYEGNACPAVGFVRFSPSDSSFSLWNQLPLPEQPFALFRVEQDKREFWIGTDIGVFRIDKRTRKCIHYQIRSGLISTDGTKLFSSGGDFDRRNESLLVAKLDKGDRVQVVGVHNAWCEIVAPTDVFGFVASSDVRQVVESPKPPHGRFLRLKSVRDRTIEIKSSAARESNSLLGFDFFCPPRPQYEVVGESGQRLPDGTVQVEWYKVRLPTAWVHRDRMTYCLD